MVLCWYYTGTADGMGPVLALYWSSIATAYIIGAVTGCAGAVLVPHW